MAMRGHAGPPGDDGAAQDITGRPVTGGGPAGPAAGSEGREQPGVPAPQARSADEQDDLLACGRSLYALWEDGDDGGGPAVPHPADCPHCAAALREIRALDDFVQEARTAEADVPPPDASAVTARVMDLVRLELRPGRTLPLGDREEDHWIMEAAAAKTFRAAAETVAGVRAGSCRIGPLPGSPAPDRGPVRVSLGIEAGSLRALPALAEAVRAAVVHAADRAVGLRVAEVDVTVLDVFDEAEAAEEAPAEGAPQGRAAGGRAPGAEAPGEDAS
jgi:hypothetical protein